MKISDHALKSILFTSQLRHEKNEFNPTKDPKISTIFCKKISQLIFLKSCLKCDIKCKNYVYRKRNFNR